MAAIPDVGQDDPSAVAWKGWHRADAFASYGSKRERPTTPSTRSAFIFTLDCDDAKTRKTRLLNLDWSFDGDSKRKSSEEACSGGS